MSKEIPAKAIKAANDRPPKIVAPMASKAEGSMQHSQEYNKLRWQNMLSAMGIKQRLSTTAKSSMSVLRRARLVLEN